MRHDLHALEQRWGLALQSASFGVWDLDVPAHQVHYSPQWKRMLGYGEDDTPDSTATWRSRVHPDDLQPMVDALTRHLHGDSAAYEHEFRLRAADGSWRWVLSRGRVVQRGPDGEALRAVGTLTDLTDRRDAERLRLERDRAEAASQAKTEFLSRMSHELRTPLNAVLGFAQVLGQAGAAPSPEALRRYAGFIEQAGWQLLHMVDDALDLAGLESGRLALDVQAVDLDASLRAALAHLADTAALAGVRLREPPTWPAARARADPARLQQVLRHLLHNAVHHSRRGSEVEIRIQAQPGTWCLSVRDNGPGMATDQLQHLFEPFNRQGRPAAPAPDSVGLGLALMHSLVRSMGGQLTAHSTLGQGSRFDVSLPAA